LIDLHIADLLPSEPEITRKDTMAYRITEEEADDLAETAVAALQTAMGTY
jgi:hypothetical protein